VCQPGIKISELKIPLESDRKVAQVGQTFRTNEGSIYMFLNNNNNNSFNTVTIIEYAVI